MKNLMISFITLLIFLHTTSYYVISTEAQDGSPDPVRDVDGNALCSDNVYYAISRTHLGGAGGLVPYPLPGKACTIGVSQLLYGAGTPLAFHQPSPVLGSPIYEHIDLNITFSKWAGCGSGVVWRRGEYDEASGQYFVEIGTGVAWNSEGEESIGNAFQIRKAQGDFYKFVFCPKTCVSCHERCDDVGIFIRDGLMVLAVKGDTPLYFRFHMVVPKLATH